MAFLSNIFGKRLVAPERVPTDEVIPLFPRDDTPTNRAIVVEFTMVFDDVLDAEKLSSALWKLFERPGWRKLGARLRQNGEGKLEYHVPAQYTQERPPINYTHIVEAMPYRQHPLGANIPVANDRLQVFSEISKFRISTEMSKIDDWIYTDRAQLGLHITSFTDATFVTITWLHTLLDAMGRHALLRAWQAELEGRQVPDFIGYDTNPLADLGKRDFDGEDCVLAPKAVSKLGMLRFVFNMIWETYWYPQEESRTLVVPAGYLTKLKAQALDDLATLEDKSKLTYSANEKTAPFLSDGDVLTAWMLRLTARVNPAITTSAPTRLTAVMNVMGMRDLFRNTEPQLLPKDGVYIHNCVTAIWSHFAIKDFLSQPLGHIAAQIRHDLVKQSTRAQIEASQALAQKGAALFGSGDMAFSTMTNWSKAKLFETDFSAATVKKGSGNGKPIYIHPVSIENGFPLRGSTACVGKDAHGNIWLGTAMRKENVEAFEQEVESLA